MMGVAFRWRQMEPLTTRPYYAPRIPAVAAIVGPPGPTGATGPAVDLSAILARLAALELAASPAPTAFFTFAAIAA
jgi:hypothetical protein